MAWKALIFVWCLSGPLAGGWGWEAIRQAPAARVGPHLGDAARTRRLADLAAAGRQKAIPCDALLVDIDDDEIEDDPSSAAVWFPLNREIGLAWVRAEARPGSGQVLHLPSERIPLRC